MQTQCMNPIIYIDELDKISKTENGKEIIGILTHLTDSTQNDEFSDKYFSYKSVKFFNRSHLFFFVNFIFYFKTLFICFMSKAMDTPTCN